MLRSTASSPTGAAPSNHGEGRIRGPVNLRVYGILVRDGTVLVAGERVGEREVLKFPGGGVGVDETPEDALRREFAEECGMEVTLRRLLHAPGTLFSPWTHTNYTPLYYLVDGAGEPAAPAHEALTLSFIDLETALKSGRMAGPEIFALSRALGTIG